MRRNLIGTHRVSEQLDRCRCRSKRCGAVVRTHLLLEKHQRTCIRADAHAATITKPFAHQPLVGPRRSKMNVDAPSTAVAEAIGMSVASRVCDDRARRAVEAFACPHFEAPFHHDAHVSVRMLMTRHDHAWQVFGRIDAQIAACHRVDDGTEVLAELEAANSGHGVGGYRSRATAHFV
jgi:hypothetical protein